MPRTIIRNTYLSEEARKKINTYFGKPSIFMHILRPNLSQECVSRILRGGSCSEDELSEFMRVWTEHTIPIVDEQFLNEALDVAITCLLGRDVTVNREELLQQFSVLARRDNI